MLGRLRKLRGGYNVTKRRKILLSAKATEARVARPRKSFMRGVELSVQQMRGVETGSEGVCETEECAVMWWCEER